MSIVAMRLLAHGRAGFSMKQFAGAFDAPPASRDGSVPAHDAMAGDDEGERVRRAGLRNSQSGSGATNAPGDFRIGDRRAHRALQANLHHALPEGGANNRTRT